MASTDVKSDAEKLSVERRSFEITRDKDLFQHDELSPEDREFLETFGEERRKAVVRKVKQAKLTLRISSNDPRN
jgi:hypothetical protein